VWRYNHRSLTVDQQIDKLMKLLYNYKTIKVSG